MTIDPEQMREWARPPGEFMLSWTKDVLHDALRKSRLLRERGYKFGTASRDRAPDENEYEVFLQGSYANGTNISDSSDVDLVILLKMPFEEEVKALKEKLHPGDIENFHRRYAPSPMTSDFFSQDVQSGLKERYYVRPRSKCVNIADWDSIARVPADILPAMEYRRYDEFPASGKEKYDEGIFFRDKHGTSIINYPKQHLLNGNSKDRWTGGRFKEVIRVAKNARHKAIEVELLDKKEVAPSYFIECLYYNVPDTTFRTSLHSAFYAATRWLHRKCTDSPDEFNTLLCQNKLVNLFGKGPDQWCVCRAEKFLNALLGL
ncbi:Uncharacterised protein [Amycolatopsis camponoti]|uniref:Uncharacterized protein n=1 Tax=Amycolatopsis camponoti TaxID=2606593 RepID=A0A6I8LWT2_9PSEU|nr:nucleotidyltransferase [Amycolatopsis camponoti]VVJ21600.1 Uncharacterised protein [Amycolatopsis camponoti]